MNVRKFPPSVSDISRPQECEECKVTVTLTFDHRNRISSSSSPRDKFCSWRSWDMTYRQPEKLMPLAKADIWHSQENRQFSFVGFMFVVFSPFKTMIYLFRNTGVSIKLFCWTSRIRPRSFLQLINNLGGWMQVVRWFDLLTFTLTYRRAFKFNILGGCSEANITE